MNEWTAIALLDPPHKVTYPEYVEALCDALLTVGWDGPDLVGYPLGDRIQLLSGSHRYAAAILAGMMSVPVRIVPYAKVVAAWGTDAWTAIMEAT